MTARAAVARQSHDHQFGEVLERDRHDTVFGEVAVRGTAGRQTWVAGLAIERDAYTSRDVPHFDYTFTVPGVFVQYDVTVSPGCRCLRAAAWTSTAIRHLLQSAGFGAGAGRTLDQQTLRRTGFFGPTPITEETEAAGLDASEISQPLEPSAA